MIPGNKYHENLRRGVCLAVLSLLGAAAPAFGSGFAVYTQGAAALAQGNAVTAHLDDPAALFFNPALIGGLEGTQVQVGTTLINDSRTYDSARTGLSEDGEGDIHLPSTLFVTHEFSPRLTGGFGLYFPFGLGSEWDENWEGRYISTSSDLTTININPVLCWQALPNLSIAGGIDFLLLEATLDKHLNLFPLPDGTQEFEGDGTGIGFNVGALLDLGSDFALGVHYRSEIEVDVDGSADFSLPARTPEPLSLLLRDSAGSTSITMPRQFQAGLAYKGIERFVAEVGMRWEGWSSFEELRIDLDSGLSSTTERDWEDVYSFNLGGSYEVKDGVALMAGYLYDGAPAPDATFDPSIPAARSHLVSTGIDLKWKRCRFQLAYAYQKYETRTKDNRVGVAEGGAANGDYRTDNHMVAASVVYRFR